MRQVEFEQLLLDNSFDVMCCFDVNVLIKTLNKYVSSKEVLLDVQALQLVKNTLDRERGASKKPPKELVFFENLCRNFLDVYLKDYETRFGALATLGHVETACKHVFETISSEKYRSLLLSRHKLRQYLDAWGFLENRVLLVQGRRTLNEAISKAKALECVKWSIDNYLVSKGLKTPEELKSGFEAIKDLMQKLESGSFVPVESQIASCVSFIEFMKAEGVLRLDLLSVDNIHTLAERWVARKN